LNENLLDDTPLAARLLFKMGGTLNNMVTVHESLVDLFRVKGVDIVPIADFGVSYQNKKNQASGAIKTLPPDACLSPCGTTGE
jgi:hypothetical protein